MIRKFKIREIPSEDKLRRLIIGQVRRIFWYYYRGVCLQRFNLANTAGSGKGHWKCKYCAHDMYHAEDVQIDHIDPVMDTEISDRSWKTYFDRLFVLPEKTQPLCKVCHRDKSQFENQRRKQNAN